MSDDAYTGLNTPAASPQIPEQIGAWRVVGVLGRGSTAEVYAVEHTWSGRAGALKRLRPGVRRERFRNELLGLGVLDLPGVVRILDDGIVGGAPYLVEERVDGTPFPGHPAPRSWDEFAPRVESLVLALGRLHRAGIFHLDLKAANALVDAAGMVTLVDLGLCQGPALGERPSPDLLAAGTMATIAPEQLAGEFVDGRSDLFSVGRMLAGLSGLLGWSEHIRDAVERLCAHDAASRPETAADALALLQIDPLRHLRMPVVVNGPERLVRLQSDTSAALAVGDTRAVVRGWVEAGDAVIEANGTVTITARGRRQLHSAAMAPTRPPANLEMEAQAAEAAGTLSIACRGLHQLAVQARWDRWDGRVTSTSETDVLTRWLAAALRLEDTEEVARAAYGVLRVPDAPEDLTRMARAATARSRGRPEDALEALQAPTSDPRLEAIRHRLRVQATAAQGQDRHFEVLREARAWADASRDAEIQAQVSGWTAHAHYRLGHYAEAAELHEQGLYRGIVGPRGVSAALNAASCWMEVGAYERSRSLATEAMSEAYRLRHEMLILRAEWLVRSIAYRDGRVTRPDDELLAAMDSVDAPLWRGLIRFGEAAIAWRAADPRCSEIARRAANDLTAASQREAARLSRAIEVASGHDRSGADALASAAEAKATNSDDLSWQVLGVLMLAGLLDGEFGRRVALLAQRVADPTRRREILAPIEVLAAARQAELP